MATVLSVAGVTITGNGGTTGDLLQQIINAQAGLTVVTVGGAATSLPAPPVGSGPFELVIEPDYTGALAIPAGYKFVINGATADSNQISGGDSSTAIVGGSSQPLNYFGAAGTVLGVGGTGTIDDTANGALIGVDGAYSVTAIGNADTIGVDGGGVKVTLSGSGDIINIGGGSAPAGADAPGGSSIDTVSITSGSTSDVVNVGTGTSFSHIFLSAAGTVNQAGGATTVVTEAGGSVTLNATGGSDLVFDGAGGAVVNGGPSNVFANAIGVSSATFNAASGGADTIFAQSAVDYTNKLGTASSLLFIGGAGAVTVSAAAQETVFGGAGGGSYSIGATNFLFVSNIGGADTLTGGPGATSVTAFGGSNESLTVSQMVSSPGNTFIAAGDQDSINAMFAGGGNSFEDDNQGGLAGNTTLVGSNVGHDTFSVYIDSSTTVAAHTVDIGNWQSTDQIFVINLDPAAGGALDQQDLTAVNNFLAGGSGSAITLSDGTTINFTDAKPTNIGHF